MSSHRGFILPYLTSAPLGGRILLGVLALLAVLVPFLNLAFPPESALHVHAYARACTHVICVHMFAVCEVLARAVEIDHM